MSVKFCFTTRIFIFVSKICAEEATEGSEVTAIENNQHIFIPRASDDVSLSSPMASYSDAKST